MCDTFCEYLFFQYYFFDGILYSSVFAGIFFDGSNEDSVLFYGDDLGVWLVLARCQL